MNINEKLNIVLPCGELTAYHTPISREVFEGSYRLIGLTKAALTENGLHYQLDSGPRIAALEMKRIAEDSGIEHKATALLADIKRLTTVLVSDDDGHKFMPVDTAISKGVIDAEDWKECEAALVFFTVIWASSSRAMRQKASTEPLVGVLNALITSLSITEYIDSLPKLTQDVATDMKASSIPS